MATENLSVAAAFNLSYADLTEDQKRIFRRLGCTPAAKSTPTPSQLWMTPTSPPLAASWRPCTISTC